MFKCITAIIQMSDNNEWQIIKILKAACMIYSKQSICLTVVSFYSTHTIYIYIYILLQKVMYGQFSLFARTCRFFHCVHNTQHLSGRCTSSGNTGWHPESRDRKMWHVGIFFSATIMKRRKKRTTKTI